MKNDNVILFVLVRNITYTYNDRNPNDSRYHRVSAIIQTYIRLNTCMTMLIYSKTVHLVYQGFIFEALLFPLEK